MVATAGRRRRRGPGDHSEPRADIAADSDADPYEVARAIVLRQLTDRARSRAELEAKLASRNVADEVAAAVLDRMEEVHLVDDQAFAEQWVASRHRSRGLSRRSLELELQRKGIDREQARVAVEQLDPDDERQTALELAQRKLRSTRGQEPAVRARKLAGLLARKGYPAGLAYEVVRQALEAEGQALPEAESIE